MVLTATGARQQTNLPRNASYDKIQRALHFAQHTHEYPSHNLNPGGGGGGGGGGGIVAR